MVSTSCILWLDAKIRMAWCAKRTRLRQATCSKVCRRTSMRRKGSSFAKYGKVKKVSGRDEFSH